MPLILPRWSAGFQPSGWKPVDRRAGCPALLGYDCAMDVARYLTRIGDSGPREPIAATLRRLHRAHMLSVPFENLDIGHRPIVPDEVAFVRKVVDEHRGGFCYELNGAFSALLRAMRFNLRMLSAGVSRKAGGFGPDFDHLALLVEIEGEQWLADVGFGDSFLEPLRFEPGREQNDPAGLFRITPAGHAFLLERFHDGAWDTQYRFTLAPHGLTDYAGMCEYHQTSPQSSFTQSTICSLAMEDGRITLSGLRLIATLGGVREERELASDAEWREALRDHFAIVLPF